MSQGQGFSLFKTHCDASGIEHATTGNFTSPTDTNLIVAKSNVIEIYKLPDVTLKNSKTKLLLVAKYRLFGEIQDIKTARFVPNYCDSLLITFPDAKLSVIDFDESQRNIKTRALFNFDELYRRIGNITSSHSLTIKVDPIQRCAALRISNDLLFILPLFDKYLKLHKSKKGSNPINVIFKDTLSNEHQQEIEREERRQNGDSNNNHNHNNHNNNNNNHNRRKPRNNHRYISPIPSRNNNNDSNNNNTKPDITNNDKNEESVEQEDIEYLDAMKGDKDSKLDTAFNSTTFYEYSSLMSKTYFIINLRTKCEKIVDFIFLDGYNTPQILLLFEKTATWGGRTPVRNTTISILSITLNVVAKKYNIPFILYDKLTYDFNKLYGIPSTNHILHSSDVLRRINNKNDNHNNSNINYGGHTDRNFGGALIFGSNCILHFGQTIDYGLSLNKHGDTLSCCPFLRRWTERVINLENCNLTLLKNNINNMNKDKDKEKSMDFVLSDGDGFMYLLSISSGKMNLCTMGMGPIPSTMITISNRLNHFIFIGSRLADSLLICHQIRETKKKEIILPKEQKNKPQTAPTQNDLAISLFGNNNNDDNDKSEKENKNSRKRSYSEMNVDVNDGGDLAMSLFGVTTETLEAAIDNDISMENQDENQKSPSSKEVSISIEQNDANKDDTVKSRHLTLFGPKVKRRKLSTNKELQIHDLNFINVTDFNEEKLFELEIEKERASRQNKDEFDEENNNNKQTEQENEIQLKQHAKNEEILRKKYKFKLHDMMTNLSPITSVVMSKSYDTRYLHGDYINMMASTGYGTQGKLSIVHEGIRPQLLAKTNSNQLLSNVVNCWTLFKQKQDKYHKYLVVTNLYKTQLLDIKDKIKVIDKSDFNIDSRTIICDHINESYIVQVHVNGVRLLNDLKLIYQYKLDDDNLHIIDAHICDEYILIHLSDKTIRLLIFDKSTKTFKAKSPNLARYKTINEKEKDRRKKEFISRRCNRMTWPQYQKLESSINEFLSVFGVDDGTKNINALIQYIDETLINPSIKENQEEKKEEKKEDKTKTSSGKQEMNDSDDEDDIQLADHLKQKQISSTGWQGSDWTKQQKQKKTLFNLNLSIQVILRRLYGKQLNDSFCKPPNEVLQDMITKDLDIGGIEKTYLYKYGGIKTDTLKHLNAEWNATNTNYKVNTPKSYKQLLEPGYQANRREIMSRLAAKGQSIYDRKGRRGNEEIMADMMFGEEEEEENKMDVENDNNEQDKNQEQEPFVVIARTSGTLQIFKIPQFKLVFECSEIQIGHDLLANNLIHDESMHIILSKHQLTKRKTLKEFVCDEIENKIKNNETYFDDELIPIQLKDELWCPSSNFYNDIEAENQFETRKVEEIYVNTFDNNPYLFIFLSNGDLLMYEIFEYFQGGTSLLSKIGRNLLDKNVNQMEILPIRLKRFAHKLFTKKTHTKHDMKYKDIFEVKRKIYPINNINGLKGTLITGNHKAIVLSHRGCPIIHDFSVKHDIRGFAMFNHSKLSKIAQDDNILNGCVYFNQYGLIIATIPKTMHNISFNSDTFNKEKEDNKDDKDDKEKEEKEEKKAENKEEQKEEKKEEKEVENGNKEKTKKGKEEKEDDEEDKEEDKKEDDEENDQATEIFGHSFVLQKQKINSSKEYIDIDYNFEYPVAHIPLSETLHFNIKHENSGTYLLIMSRYKYIAGTEMLKSRDIRPIETYFECRLFNPYKWRFDDRLTGFTIQQTTEESSIPVSEHILCGKSVIIQESSRIGSQTVINKNMIILGTGTNQGEDSASIGRIVMLEIIADKESQKANTIERDERFYIQSRNNSHNLLSSSLYETSLEDDNMYNIYLNSTENQREYYCHELSYYKKCMQQDKIENIKYRIHYVFARRERAAVTAVNCVNGLILAAIGPKLLLFRWDGTQLIGCAFLDTRIHCHNILVLKNFIVTSDIFQGLDLFHWEQDIATIIKLARDVQYRSIYSTNLMINNNNNGDDMLEFKILVSDMHQNIHIINYQPHLQYGFLNKFDKEKLYTNCLFHIGTDITDSIIMKFRGNNSGNNYFNLNVCSNGSINYLIPITGTIYNRLRTLHSQMIFYCQHYCGLNPREYRYCMNNCILSKDVIRNSHIMYNHNGLNAIHGMDRSPAQTSRNIIDHDLIEQFLTLDYRTQHKLIFNIGVQNSNVIINHLSRLYNNTKWF